jgi:hypothetical protein
MSATRLLAGVGLIAIVAVPMVGFLALLHQPLLVWVANGCAGVVSGRRLRGARDDDSWPQVDVFLQLRNVEFG